MQDVLEQYARKPLQYENVDGTVDLSFGVFCFGFALWPWLLSRDPDSMSYFWLTQLAVFGPIQLCSWLGTKWFRRRFTYPRTGEIAPRGRWRLYLLACGIAVVGSAALALLRVPNASLVLFGGIGIAAGGLIGAYRTRMLRVVYLSAVALLLGIGLHLLHLKTEVAANWFFVLLGAAWLISGGVTMYRYLQRTAA